MSQASVLISALSQLQKTNLSTAAATAWLTYEILITLGQEINYIWKAQWSSPKVLYLASRYYGLFNLAKPIQVTLTPNMSVNVRAPCYLTHIFDTHDIQLCVITISASVATPHTSHRCEAWGWFDAFSGVVFFTTTVNFILLLRIHALYGRNKTVLIFLLTLYSLTIRQIHFIPIPPNVPLLGCLSAGHPPRLTLISCDSGVIFPWEGRSLAPVTSLFLRDGASFFA
ncbi:hypothetical protein JB92DRAFT_3033002, partial [Gautieria morchelliformis]